LAPYFDDLDVGTYDARFLQDEPTKNIADSISKWQNPSALSLNAQLFNSC